MNVKMVFIVLKGKPRQSARLLDDYILYRLVKAKRSRLTKGPFCKPRPCFVSRFQKRTCRAELFLWSPEVS